MRHVLCLLLVGCGGDEQPEPTIDQGVYGTLSLDTGCSEPVAIDVYDALPDAGACDWSPEFDTGDRDTGHWTDNVGEVAVSAPVSEGAFEAELDPGAYEARVMDDCYGCVAFAVSSGEVTEVDLRLQETIYADAPNIYLYPEVATDVNVRLSQARNIAVAEPDYPIGGWRVRAMPDGTLIADGDVIDFLFYELRAPALQLQYEAGWCVPGRLAQGSVEEAMAQSGFNAAEIEDFADFWDAWWPDAAWMTVYPQTARLGRLVVDPEPDSMLRLWFVVEDGCAVVDEPVLPQVERHGFHVAEWGVVFDRAYSRKWEVGR